MVVENHQYHRRESLSVGSFFAFACIYVCFGFGKGRENSGDDENEWHEDDDILVCKFYL